MILRKDLNNMFFPRKLKTPLTPEELVDKFNQANLTGGKLRTIENDVPLAPGYIIFEQCDDMRFAIVLCTYSKKNRQCFYIKAGVQDISNFANALQDQMISNAVYNVAGNLGSIAMGVVTGSFSKNKETKKLAKTTNKEIIAFMDKNGL